MKIFARVLCVVCDVVGCSIPTNQVCDDASFFFKMIARPHPPPPLFPPRHPLRHRLQATISNCACVLSVTTYSYDKLQEERRPEWRRRKKTDIQFFFSSITSPRQPSFVSCCCPSLLSNYYKKHFFFFFQTFGSCSYLSSIFPLSFLSSLIHL